MLLVADSAGDLESLLLTGLAMWISMLGNGPSCNAVGIGSIGDLVVNGLSYGGACSPQLSPSMYRGGSSCGIACSPRSPDAPSPSPPSGMPGVGVRRPTDEVRDRLSRDITS